MTFVQTFDRISEAAASDAAIVEACRAAEEAARRPLPWPRAVTAALAPVPDMSDPDDAMAHEARQQDLVDGVVRDLNAHFGSVRDPAVVMRTLRAVLALAYGVEPEPSHGLEFVRCAVADPVRRFACHPAEARVLMVRVAGKVFGSLAADAEAAWLRETILAR